ncbi:hypothetical protein GF322_04460 [Candidatus Dependentiae bacterium]|nr:hypothetical protein [Candidatus Dependentiae bacterium]
MQKVKFLHTIFVLRKQDQAGIYYNFIKQILLGITFFFIIATYSVIRPLKTAVFLGMVGKEFVPIAKIVSIIILFPCLIFYARLVDKLKRYQVMCFFLFFYVVALLITSIILLHPTIGLSNSETNQYRIFGWIFYLLIDLFSPLVVATFWAFSNSINNPEDAKTNYGRIVAFSRIGGIFSTFFCWLIIKKTSFSFVYTIPAMLICISVFLVCATFCITRIIKKIPKEFLRGYEAVYLAEKNRKKEQGGLWSGLKFIITQPYVFGIFGIVYIYEVISILTDYQMQVLMSIQAKNMISDMTAFMFMYTMSFQLVGLFFAFFGTGWLLKKIGVSLSLFIMPISIIIFMFILFNFPSLNIIFVIMVLLRALNYGFNAPVKEILYIPTIREIKFKSKAWIDSLGKSLSKTSGSTFSFIAYTNNYLRLIRMNSIIVLLFSFIWIFIVFGLGKKYTKTIKCDQVIGR